MDTKMKTNPLCAELLSIARASDDAAASCEAQAARHRPEYERCLVKPSEATPALHQRALELYPHVITAEREAKRLRREAEVMRQAAAALLEMKG